MNCTPDNPANGSHQDKIEDKPTGVFIPPEDRPNPHHVPKSSLHIGLSIYGCRVNNFGDKHGSAVDHVTRLRNMPVRKDDVLIAAYPKSGTHWLWEVVHMLVHGTTNYEDRVKEFNMLEACDIKDLESEESPRVLNSHLWMSHLPQGLFQQKAKIIHVVRNPKDVVVSLYHHYAVKAESGFSVGSLMNALMENETLHAPHQLEYLRHMTHFQQTHPEQPVKVIYYEMMKRDPVAVTKELAEFLEVSHTDEFCREVADACCFDKMKKADKEKSKPAFFGALAQKVNFYRKGTISDWKNHLTVAQNEEFDAFIADEVAKGGLQYNFIYS